MALPKFVRIGGKILLWFVGSVIVLVVAILIFIQTDTFNQYALEFTLDKLNSSEEKNGNRLNAESLTGNIFDGMKLTGGNITVKDDTLLRFNYMEVKYDVWGLLDNRITVSQLTLKEPFISAEKIKSGDSLIWNFENLFRSDVIDTSESSPFEWDVSVENMKIENGFIRVAGDSTETAPWWKEKRNILTSFDFNNTDISELNLDISAKYYRDYKSVTLNNLSFNTNSDFDLHKLKFNVNLNEKDTLTEIWGFELLTNRSDVKIYHMRAEKFNPFYDFVYEDLGNKQVDLSIDILKFNFDDLTFFLPEIDFLDSVAAVKLDASGKYGDLNAENITVRLENSVINLKGNIKNLQNPDSLYFDVTGKDIVINSADVNQIYTGGIPDFSNIGTIRADLKYKGSTSAFSSEFIVNTDAGYADGFANLDLDKEIYSGYVNTRALDLGRILKDRSLGGGINLTAKFDGTGFDLNSMRANVTYSMTGSRVGKYDVRSSAGTINARRGAITLNIRHNSSMGNADIKGMVNISNMNSPSYNLKGNVRGLDISRVTGDADSKSNLNFTFDVNGRGISPENINGVYKLDISESNFGEYEIPQTPVDAEIVNNNSSGRVKLVTDMAEFNAEGSFKIDRIIDALMYNISRTQQMFTESLGNDSMISTGTENVYTNTGDFGLKYSLVSKDSVKLQRVLQPFGISFTGNVNGEMKNSADEFTSVTRLDVKDFSYGDTVIIVKNIKSNLDLNNKYSSGLGGMIVNLNTTSDKISFGANSFDSLLLKYNMAGNTADFVVKAGMDSSAKANIQGNLQFSAGSIRADLDTVLADYSGFRIENSGNWIFTVQNADMFNFEQFKIKSRNAILDMNGYLAINEDSDLKIEGSNMKITDIASIINQADSSYLISADEDIEGELTKLLVTFKGNMQAPVLSTELNTNTLKYRESDIGVITAKVNYENDEAKANVKFQNAENKGDLIITARIPYKNPLSGDTTQLTGISTSPVDINLKANNFLLDYFSVLVNQIASLRGVLNADLSAKGTASDPALTGSLKITEGAYLLPLTGMDYSFEASMSTDNFKLVLDNLKLYNENDDSRHIDLSGSLDFKDLKITDIDIQATGDMVLLDTDVEQNDMGVYGYILAGIGTPPVKIEGSLDSLLVSGQLLIKDATISSIPLEGSGYNTGDDNFVYIDAGNDSANFIRDSTLLITPEEYALLNPFERARYLMAVDSSREMYVNLDLNVKTENNIYASIDFNNLTRDRLFGELKADLDIKTVNGQMQAFGTVDVAGDSYYRFYRDFKLDESNIKFDGDIGNPELDIKGVYSSQKNTEQYGSVTTSEVEVVITVKGTPKNPELSLGLYQDGSEVAGSDAQSDAITYLLFGRFKSELTASERTAVASSLGASVGSLYASSYLSQTVREILPFIVDAQFNYTEGNVKDTDVELISELGDARVKFGGKLFKEVKNFEIVVDYPLNKLLNLNLPETLLLEFAREEKKQALTTSQNDLLTTEIKILYKIKF
ncbi:MAG: translocation/assembly module TamB domain-containing protein [Ignavibacteria bacterium]|nr:translocation/assembly module TamB domain-containing protein [Ignavibacteria bacterium]